MHKILRYIKRHKIKSTILVLLVIAYYFCLPKPLFKDPTATVIEDYQGRLLGAYIAKDGQWRFPHNDSIPLKFKECLILFEDEYFYQHPGFNPISIFKAMRDNMSSSGIKRGGSTLTQQTIRLSRKGRSRTYWEKAKELILATRLEWRYSKDEILAFYTSNAPFGGNVVGLDAASWRYFNRNANDLSWAESATLAVLPNAPSLIYPGKNQERLLEKRNRLLAKVLEKGLIDTLTYQLSIAETLPLKPYPLPKVAPHLLQRIAKTHYGQRIKTSVQTELQASINTIVQSHYQQLQRNEIYNAAVLVLDVHTRKVLAYVGNTSTDADHQHAVDVINKPRSTGSVFKPFLYAAMLDSGDLLPNTLVPDVPTQYGNYNPENYDKTFDGAVSAKRALARSLNVPSVRLLKQFGLDRFYQYLLQLRLKDLKYNANHYGLSLILGGAESNLWDLCKSYAGMAGTLNHFNDHSSQYYSKEFIEPSLMADFKAHFGELSDEKSLFDAASVYLTFESMKEVNRPEGDENWEFFDASKEIAWKTGTSFGFRDAWAIGVTQNYVVGVWVGNADGEGRPGLVGVQTAAPILFEVFDLMPQERWFNKPYDAMQEVAICAKSGYRAGPNCDQIQQEHIGLSGLKTTACPYHQLVHLDASKQYRVNSSCISPSEMQSQSWFVLPPLMAFYYQSKNPFYKPLPPYRDDCNSGNAITMQFIYPKQSGTFFLPKDFDGNTNELVFKLAHSKPETKVFWYLDDTFIGSTEDIHDMALLPSLGPHTITVVDSYGNEASRKIDIVK